MDVDDVLIFGRETAIAAAIAATIVAGITAIHGLDKDLADLGSQRCLFANGLVGNNTSLGLYGQRRGGLCKIR